LKEEKDLSSEHVRTVLELCRQYPRDFCLFGLYVNYGLRRGEVIGGDQPTNKSLPGVLIENIRWNEGYSRLIGKGYSMPDFDNQTHRWREAWKTFPIQKGLLETIKEYTASRSTGRLLELSHQTPNDLIVKYAQAADIDDAEQLHPHRIRHWFHGVMAGRLSTEIDGKPFTPFELYDLTRHDRTPLGVIARYIPATPLERRRAIIGEIFRQEKIPLL
jgi:integrase